MSLELSVVVPMYNEQEVLPLFVERLRPVLDATGVAYEVVAVDDGSRDQTPVLLQRFLRDWPQLRVVRLRANAGHQAAISAGLAAARGDWVATIDADLQDPPEVIAEMLEVGRRDEVDVLAERSRRSLRHALDRAADDLEHQRARARAMSPLATLQRGYAVLQDADGHVVTSVTALSPGDPVSARVADGRVQATTTALEEEPDD